MGDFRLIIFFIMIYYFHELHLKVPIFYNKQSFFEFNYFQENYQKIESIN